MKSLPRTLLLLTLAHGLVDAFSSLVQPLWPDLQRGLALPEGSIQWAYILWGMATSVSQLAFGYFGERDRGRWLLWAGPVVGVVSLSLVGVAPTFPALCALLIVGGLGIAAFHPEAAAMAGASTPHERSRAMSIFAVGGYLGQAAGPVYSGVVTTHFGLPALAWSLIWGVPIVLLLVLGLNPRLEAESRPTGNGSVPLRELVRGKETSLVMVLLIGVLRVIPAMGVPLALSYMMKGRGDSNEQIGIVQAAFLAGIGAGNLGCAMLVRHGIERRVLWQLPLLVAPAVWACAIARGLPLLVCVAVGGLLLGITLPILVSYGQRLMPEGQRVASSITMGVTWGLGGGIVAATTAIANQWHRPDLAFPFYAAACLGSSILCAWLPEPRPAPVLSQV